MNRTPRPPDLSAAGFRRAALRHLRRYPSSEANLRRVLRRRAQRAVARGQTEASADDFGPLIDALILDLRGLGLLDDAGYAKGLANSLFRRGKPPRAIAHALREKGVPDAQIEAALAGIVEDHVDPELLAATRYARRRRLGPFRRGDRAERRDRDLASLGRQGFGYGVAAKVIDAGAPEDLPDE